jgi:hypothetical protein
MAQDTTQQMAAAHWLMACAIPNKDNLQSFISAMSHDYNG